LIAYRHVRGASDGEIARELGVDRSSVRRARKRPASLELIAAERKRAAKRAESQRYRDRKKHQRELAARSIPEAEEAAELEPRGSGLGSRSQPAGAVEGRPQAERRLRVTGNRGAYVAWLDERDARVPLTRADLYSRNDDAAARVVAGGGGMQAVIEATGLRTRENVLRVIDPAILEEARQNDAALAAAAESVD
jgi:hypothetical protein